MTAGDIRPRYFDTTCGLYSRGLSRERRRSWNNSARNRERLRAAGENEGEEARDKKKGWKETGTMDDEGPCVVRKAR